MPFNTGPLRHRIKLALFREAYRRALLTETQLRELLQRQPMQ